MILSISSGTLLGLLLKYKYLILYPAVFIEGTISMIMAGFLSSVGVMNPFAAFFIIIAADMSSDAFFYFIGWLARIWRVAAWFVKRFAPETKRARAIYLFEKHSGKMFIVSKITQSLAGVFLMGAGFLRFRPSRIIYLSFMGALIKAAVLFSVGMTVGSTYEVYAKKFEYGALIISIISIIVVIIFSFLPRRFLNRFINMDHD